MARARLVGICRDDESENFQRHQLPVYVDDMRTMTVEFDDPCRGIDPSQSLVCPGMTIKQFRQKAASLKPEELEAALTVDCDQFNILLSQIVACVGCRRSVEKLYTDLASMGHLAVHPLVINQNSTLSVEHSVLLEQKLLYKLLIGDGGKVRAVLENLTKCRKNKRCSLHSLDMHVCKTKIGWEELWDVMSEDCRDECCVVESESLLDMLETYLQKHKFCNECRTKVMKAFNLLIGDGDRTQEKGFNPSLYQGLKYCPTEQHLHLKPSAAYLNMLIDRAEPELLGRERHAKTLDVAQGEVLTCLGLYMYDRLHRLAMALKTLQMTFQLLYCTGIIALHTSFQEMLESKHGLSDSLERLCAELQDSAANPAQKNVKCSNGNKKVKKKPVKSQGPLNDCKELVRKSLVEDQCQKCSRRKSSCNLTPSHSPLRSVVISVSRSKQTRSLSPNRSCICVSSAVDVDPGEKQRENCNVPCNGSVGNTSDDGAYSDCDTNTVGDVPPSGAQLNCISSSSFRTASTVCSNFDSALTERPSTNDRCSDAGYCSQELSPDGGSPQNDMQRLVRNKTGAVVYSTCCDTVLKMQSSDDFCCNRNASSDLPSLEFEKIVATNSCNEVNSTASSSVCGCSLMDMLEDEESDGNNVTGCDDQSISPEEIEWFQQNQLLVSEERRALRERLVQRFEDMQARMTMMTVGPDQQGRSS